MTHTRYIKVSFPSCLARLLLRLKQSLSESCFTERKCCFVIESVNGCATSRYYGSILKWYLCDMPIDYRPICLWIFYSVRRLFWSNANSLFPLQPKDGFLVAEKVKKLKAYLHISAWATSGGFFVSFVMNYSLLACFCRDFKTKLTEWKRMNDENSIFANLHTLVT